jgi:hypothetical protein
MAPHANRVLCWRHSPGQAGGARRREIREPAYSLCRCNNFFPMTMRWISEVPSPISSSGASR